VGRQVVVGCKSDRPDDREISEDDAMYFARSLNAEYIPTSAKEDINVIDAFKLAGRAWLKAKAAQDQQPTPNGFEHRPKDAKQFFQKTNCILQ
jgi:hypothetical protein